MKFQICMSMLFFVFGLVCVVIFLPGCRKHFDADSTAAVGQILNRVRL